MASLKDVEAQARKANEQRNKARRKADEKLGKQLRELVAKAKTSREDQVERTQAFLDACGDEIKQLADALDGVDATDYEQGENDDQEDGGEQYGNSSYA